jgi:hypothetical protein
LEEHPKNLGRYRNLLSLTRDAATILDTDRLEKDEDD